MDWQTEGGIWRSRRKFPSQPNTPSALSQVCGFSHHLCPGNSQVQIQAIIQLCVKRHTYRPSQIHPRTQRPLPSSSMRGTSTHPRRNQGEPPRSPPRASVQSLLPSLAPPAWAVAASALPCLSALATHGSHLGSLMHSFLQTNPLRMRVAGTLTPGVVKVHQVAPRGENDCFNLSIGKAGDNGKPEGSGSRPAHVWAPQPVHTLQIAPIGHFLGLGC